MTKQAPDPLDPRTNAARLSDEDEAEGIPRRDGLGPLIDCGTYIGNARSLPPPLPLYPTISDDKFPPRLPPYDIEARLAKLQAMVRTSIGHLDKTLNQVRSIERQIDRLEAAASRSSFRQGLLIAFALFLPALFLLIGCGGTVDYSSTSGCPVVISPEGDPTVALTVADDWNATGNSCGAVVAPGGAPTDSTMEPHTIHALIADLVCEVSPC